MIELQSRVAKFDIKNFKILSISVDPENDTQEVLRNYISSMDIDSSNWHFLTGAVDEIYDLVQAGLNFLLEKIAHLRWSISFLQILLLLIQKDTSEPALIKRKNVNMFMMEHYLVT